MAKQKKWKQLGTSKTSPIDNTKRKKVETKTPKTENIIFIGSEMNYDSFWLKMMFISAAYAMTSKIRPADKKTIAYVDNGYTNFEKLTLDILRNKNNFEISKLSSSADIVTLLNRDRDNYKLQDVAFFSHGLVGTIALNYYSSPSINFDENSLAKMKNDTFVSDGRIYSYACRTGVSVEDYKLGFSSEAEAKPEASLAQKMADHCGVEVHAFLRRTFYGNVLREKTQSETIAAMLKKEREHKEGQVIQIPPKHEALPHPELSNSWMPWSGSKKEGTNEYALWRKDGGLGLPVAADSPAGLPTVMRVFTPPPPMPTPNPNRVSKNPTK